MKITVDRKLMLVLSAALVLFTLSGAFIGRVVAVEGTYSYLKLFNEALYLIVNNYVQPVEIDGLMQGAYRGMLEALDPANEYLPSAAYDRAARGADAGSADVGLSLSKQRGYIVVVAALAGAPAAEAGLSTGDVVISIDGKSTRLLGPWEAARLLHGEPGSKVVLNVSAASASGRKDMTLTRRVLPPPVPGAALEGDAGVLRIVALREGDARRADQAIASLRRRGATRLLVDLRGCTSDALAESIGVASLFVSKGTIVQVMDRYDGDKAYTADGRRLAWDGPVAVLTDSGTAGACEVLAAALRDDRQAPLLGEGTWGRGRVYRLLPLQHGDGVILAVGKYLSPAGKDWNGKGLQPDLELQGTATTKDDPQRQKALDYLRGMSLTAGRQAA